MRPPSSCAEDEPGAHRRIAGTCRPTFPSGSTGPSRARARSRIGPSSSAPGPAGLFAGYLLAQDGYRPLILERGRAVKDRVADVRRFDDDGPARSREQLPLRRGGRRHVQRRQAHLARHRPRRHAVSWRSSPTATASRRSSTNTGRTSGSNRLPLVVRTLRRKFEALGGEIRFSCRVEDLDIADGRLRGLSTSSGYIAADLAILAIGHSARDTYDMLLRRGVPIEAKPFQLGVRIEQPQAAIDRARYGPAAGHPALGAADYSASVRTGQPRPVHVLHVRRRLRDAQRQRARLLLHQRHEREPPRLAVRQQRPGRHHRAARNRQPASPGRRSLPAAVRAPRLSGRRRIVQGPDPVGPRFPRRPTKPRDDPHQLSPRGRCG